MNNVVTGSRDGSIKVWTEDFEIRLVFVGHIKPVISLNVYPQVSYFIFTVYFSSKPEVTFGTTLIRSFY